MNVLLVGGAVAAGIVGYLLWRRGEQGDAGAAPQQRPPVPSTPAPPPPPVPAGQRLTAGDEGCMYWMTYAKPAAPDTPIAMEELGRLPSAAADSAFEWAYLRFWCFTRRRTDLVQWITRSCSTGSPGFYVYTTHPCT